MVGLLEGANSAYVPSLAPPAATAAKILLTSFAEKTPVVWERKFPGVSSILQLLEVEEVSGGMGIVPFGKNRGALRYRVWLLKCFSLRLR